MTRQRILIVDDEPDMLQGLKRMLGRELPELEIIIESDPGRVPAIVGRETVDLVLLDIRMPDINGLELLAEIRRIDPVVTVIMMTGYGTIETAVEAMKGGAYDFITKPFERQPLVRALVKGLEHTSLLRENRDLRRRVGAHSPFAEFVGRSKPMQRLYHAIRTMAGSDYTVLIRGESGTGKELTAQAIHALSKRRRRPMVMVNCPAIPEHLLESELFGHRRGAFTGADQDRDGLFAEADGSTLCLDEIGDIPVTVQTKLLRALQDHEIKPVGAARSRKIDVRIIASTNADLEERIRRRSFREDLYYRLNVVTVRTPSLAEIREDIPLLVDHFTRRVCRELDLPDKRFSPAALEELIRRPWPGNVRELQNVVRGAVLFCPDGVIDTRYLRRPPAAGEPAVSGHEGGGMAYKEAKEQLVCNFTVAYVEGLLRDTGGNVSRAAAAAGLTRAALQKIMRRHGIKSEYFRPA